MALYRRGETWWIDVTTPGGKRVRQSAQTTDRKAAKEFHDQIKAQVWRTDKLGEKTKRSWDEAALKFLKESEGKASLRDYKCQIAFWTEHFRGTPGIHHTSSCCRSDRIPRGNTSYQESLHRVSSCRIDESGRRVGVARTGAPKFKSYSEPKLRVRWITEEEASRLIPAMPTWMQPLVKFALGTGVRQANVLGLEWAQIDLAKRFAWIHLDQAKARRAIGIPLNEDMVDVLRQQRGKHLTRVFVGPDRQPLGVWDWTARRAWDGACKQAGIENFRFHDLRHTWASSHIQRGTPLYALKELGGWETLEMVKKYAHLSSGHLLSYADNLTSES